MSVVFDLPDELCREVISEWLDSDDLVWLDSAVCSQQWRPQLMALLLVAKGVCDTRRGFKNLDWLQRRRIGLKELILINPSGIWISALSSHWIHLEYLNLIHNSTSIVGKHIFCPNLISLRINGMDFISWDVDTVSRLTELQVTCSGYIEAQRVLIIIRTHCRKLKTFHYRFKPIAQTSEVLLDIIRQNFELTSLNVHIDERMQQGLISLSLGNLIRLSLSGSADFSTVVDTLHKFNRMDSIEIVKYSVYLMEPSLYYTRSRSRLELFSPFPYSAGWTRFVAHMEDLRELVWHRKRKRMELFVLISDTGDDTYRNDEPMLKTILSSCTSLRTFTWYCEHSIYWPEVLHSANVIEEMTIERVGGHLVYVLNACRCLRTLSVSHAYIDLESVPVLVDTIQKYRHTTTGEPLHCNCQFQIGDDKNRLRTLMYDGSTFDGSLLD